MTQEILAVAAFALLFVVFGMLRLRPGCASDPTNCEHCNRTCTKRPPKQWDGPHRSRSEQPEQRGFDSTLKVKR